MSQTGIKFPHSLDTLKVRWLYNSPVLAWKEVIFHDKNPSFHSYRHKKRSVIHHVFLLIWSDSRSTVSSNVTVMHLQGEGVGQLIFLTVLPTSREHRKAEKQWGSSCVEQILRCQNAGWIIRWVTIRLNGFTQQALITESRTTHGEVSME